MLQMKTQFQLDLMDFKERFIVSFQQLNVNQTTDGKPQTMVMDS